MICNAQCACIMKLGLPGFCVIRLKYYLAVLVKAAPVFCKVWRPKDEQFGPWNKMKRKLIYCVFKQKQTISQQNKYERLIKGLCNRFYQRKNLRYVFFYFVSKLCYWSFCEASQACGESSNIFRSKNYLNKK